ncbi:MAG: GYD domain-containing protein [Syntrophales bacterium]|nr:GYD domain-containing protein [Syntrophales bacterium]MDY0043855.1 GYD domain-containing protein [Syntrophales bacterium]
MSIFFMFGKYTKESAREISAERTKRAVEVINRLGGEVKSMYSLLGEHDLIFIVDLPDMKNALKVSVALNQLTGINFSTSPVVNVDEFDKMINELKEM